MYKLNVLTYLIFLADTARTPSSTIQLSSKERVCALSQTIEEKEINSMRKIRVDLGGTMGG